jgi:hypothetical protein
MSKRENVTIQIRLNGTNENPYHRLGLTCNPFPQLAISEYAAAERALQSLGADPIPDEQYIRDTLEAFPKEFVDLCVEKYKPGEMVDFLVTFELER